MLPPAFQSHLAQLASLGQQMHRLALGLNLPAAVTAAREAIGLLRSPEVTSAAPGLSPQVSRLEENLASPSPSGLRSVIADLSRILQSLGASNRPFLAIVQNAPDQRPQQKTPEEALRPGAPLQKTTTLGTIEHHWARGEHDKAVALLEALALSAKAGDIRSRTLLGEVACSTAVSINIKDLAHVLNRIDWPEFALQLINPRQGLLIPGLNPDRLNPHLLSELLSRPPAVPGAVEALQSVLKKKNRDPWGLRSRATQGLFSLTSPWDGEKLGVDRYWEILVQSWPIAVPALLPEPFGPTSGHAARWDLYERHLLRAFEAVESQTHPLALREGILKAIWAGGPVRAPKELALSACARTLDLAERAHDWVWPIVSAPLTEWDRSGFVASERLKAKLKSMLPQQKTGTHPQRLIDELNAFAGQQKTSHLRLVSAKRAAPAEGLQRLVEIAEELGTYGLVLEPALVASVMSKAAAQPSLPEDLENFRRALYPLHPAAAVTAWLDATGLPWPSYELPHGHRIEGVLALLRWLRDHEREPEETMIETARRYAQTDTLLSDRRWSAITPNSLKWWQHRLALELPNTLASQTIQAQKTGAPHDWTVYVRTHPEVLEDLRAHAQSPLPGTRVLATEILRTLNLRPAS